VKKLLIFSLLVLSLSCEKTCDVKCQINKEDWKEIDLGVFKINTPTDFKYLPVKGIDSYVGQISNSEMTFIFDYGRYSETGPRTYIDRWIEKPIRHSEIIYDFAEEFNVDVYQSDIFWMDLISLKSVTTTYERNELLYEVTGEFEGQLKTITYDLEGIDNSFESRALDYKIFYEYDILDSVMTKFYYPKGRIGHIGYYCVLLDQESFLKKLSVKTKKIDLSNETCCIAKGVLRTIKIN